MRTPTISELRKQFRLTQEELATALNTTQPKVCRIEQSGRPATEDEQTKITLFASKSHTTANRLRRFRDDVIEVAGGLVGSLIVHMSPARFRDALVQRMMKAYDIGWTEDPGAKDKRDRALAAGHLGIQICKVDERVRSALKEKRHEDVILLSESALMLVAAAPDEARTAVEPLMLKIQQNYAVSLQVLQNRIGDAQEVLLGILSSPQADTRDRALATYELAFSFIEKHKDADSLAGPVRKELFEAQEKFVEAFEIDRTNPYPAYGVLHLADLVAGLGDQIWLAEIKEIAASMLEHGDGALKKMLPTFGEAKKRFPHLSRKKGWLRNLLPWLSIVLLVLCGTSAVEPAPLHQGSYHLDLAKADHQGSKNFRAQPIC